MTPQRFGSDARSLRSGLAVAALLVATAASGAPDADGPIDVPGAELSAPPRVAVLADGRTLVALADGDGIDVATLPAGARTFEPATHVARRTDLVLGGRRGPRIVATKDVVVVSAITRRTKEGGGELLAWRSTDAGATWSDAVRVNDVPGAASEGLFDLAALGDGRFAVIWLDCRLVKGKRLFADFSADGAAWGGDVLSYESPSGSICECCHAALSATSDGGAVAAFRNSVGGDRDVWSLRLARGASKFERPTKSGKGSWKIAACPMAGPSVVVHGDDVVCAWRRESHVFLAVGGEKERDLGEGTEPQLLVRGDGVHVWWTTKDGLVHLAPGAAKREDVAKGATFPCAAGADVVAWLDASTKRARLLRVR